MFGKREENGNSTPHVLSMGSYAHTQEKHAKRDFLVKACHFTPLGTMQSQISHMNKPNMLTISTNNNYPNILETMIYYNPSIKE